MSSENIPRVRPLPQPPHPARRQIQSWQEAEHNAATWMRHWGYEDARARPGGSDGGVDVRSRKALGQVKYQGAAVGRPELQRLFGARGRAWDKDLLFFTGSSYTATAVEYAAENGIALFVYGLDGSMTAANAPARRIATTPAPPPPATPASSAPASGSVSASGSVPVSAPPPGPPREIRPGAGRTAAGLVLAVVALFIPGSDSFDPRPNQTLVTLLMLVVPAVLITSGIREKTRRRYWPTGLGLLLLDLPTAWLTNARLWRGDIADILVPATLTVLSLTAAVSLIRWNTRGTAAPKGEPAV
ncbi:restriction endonuclease [Streptomyces sp. CRN 30]|uniref:restriction endonuclease n=1 Tax=Streptomyces sp. CRN 30 TaxID=3075613 RepID=UPI002A82A448|nr:restriction endonuclease [Streptomyces sp. CRN 30]